jgi:hypothetical protein
MRYERGLRFQCRGLREVEDELGMDSVGIPSWGGGWDGWDVVSDWRGVKVTLDLI